MRYPFSLLLVGYIAGCGEPLDSSLREAIDANNDVGRLGVPIDFTPVLSQLPHQGDSSVFIWSGNWWPLAEGGTLATMRKYDLAMGRGNAAGDWEQESIKAGGGASWAGHCNGLAAASINETLPRHAALYQGQTFTVEDVQALLVEKWQGVTRIPLVGKRCQYKTVVDDYGRPTSAGCRDINAGALHVLLGNMLGLHHKPFIIDTSADQEVWNYPVDGYRQTIAPIDEATARSLTLISQAARYEWNLDATEFQKVRSDLRLGDGRILHYDYVLELKDGQVIGGEWIGKSRTEHPDFAWTTNTPELANPNLEVDVIDAIAHLSVQ